MPRRKRDVQPLATIWEIDDPLWERIEAMIAEAYPISPKGGRPRTVDFRAAVNACIYRLRSGCQWNQLPEKFGDDSTIHRWFSRWCQDRFFERIWALLLSACDELGDLNWKWQSADGCMNKARFGGGKKGTESDRPRQAGNQEKRSGRSRRRTSGSRHRRREHA